MYLEGTDLTKDTKSKVCDCCKQKDSKGIFVCKDKMICVDCHYVISWYIPMVVNEMEKHY